MKKCETITIEVISLNTVYYHNYQTGETKHLDISLEESIVKFNDEGYFLTAVSGDRFYFSREVEK